ncbi:MAG TPA: TonB-dependent receptor, partial [Gammaproteobacteria bacterium]|nr:TonB-dependent receptor [Gammaproteobacteria bacterium]
MKAEQSLRQSIRMALAAAVCLPALWVGNASAQEEEEAAALERVEVTGSRIRRAAIEGAKPVLSIAREDLDRSGVQSVGDFLQRLTMSGSALNTKFNSSGNFGFPPDGGGVGAGSTQVDLRHLDAKRALVLVDGRRWVNETSASGVGGGVDLNTIPLAIVERIEVLTDGASSIYGSDAIAGVVNIITRKDFDGVAASAYGGGYVEDGDGQTEAYDFSMGKAESSGSLFFNLSYTDQEEVSSADREISRFPIPYTGVRFGSSATPQGRFIFFDPNNDTHGGLCPQIDTDGDSVPDSAFCNITTPDGAGFPGDVPNFPNDFIPFSNALRFNFAPFNLLVTPSERTSAFLQGRHDLTDTATFYAKFLFNNRRSVNRAAPEPIFIGPEAGNGNRLDTIVIDATNPYNPFGFDLDPANGFLLLGRRPLEGGPRIFTQDVDTYYFGAGFEGVLDLGARGFEWDVNYIFSRSEAIQTTQNTYSNRNIALALGPLADCQADPECVPLNLFGGQGADGSGTITQEMLDYIRVTLHDASGQELRSYTANLSGDIADLPAGPLGVAVGYEYRDHDGFYQPDQLSSSGDANGVPSQPTRGGFTVDEFYAEFVVPVLADMPAAELFEFEAAVRSSDYSTFGSTTNSKFGFRWKPGDNWVLRGTLAEGFRAPNIGELFGGISRFDATIEDPCSSDFIAALPPALGTELRNNCTSLGVPTTFFQTNPQIAIQTGGNPDLKPETA